MQYHETLKKNSSVLGNFSERKKVRPIFPLQILLGNMNATYITWFINHILSSLFHFSTQNNLEKP
jgi:hypothetical protein